MEALPPKQSTSILPAVPPIVAPLRSSTPFLSDAVRSPYPAWTVSALLLAAVPSTVRTPLGYPHLVQLPLFALIFAGSGYMIQAGDPVNGAGTTTAWSLTYLFLHGKKALVSKRPGPIALSTVVATSAASHGWDYFYNT